jgi:glycosyltransferase involved in cell wall biosynthesis
MKVCLLHRLFPPNSGGVGGIVPYYVAMARALRDAGHDVYVFTEATGSAPDLTAEDGVTVFRLPKPPPRRGIAGELVQLAVIARHLRPFVERFEIDVVEAADYGGETALVRSSRLPADVSVKLHTPVQVKDAVLGKRAVARERVVYAIERRAILRADFLTTPSEASAELTREVFGVPSLQAAVVRNPLDLEQWRPGAKPPHEDTLLFVGRLEAYKGPDRLPFVLNRVLGRFPRARARFVGDDFASPGMTDGLRAALDPIIRARVSFGGRLDRRDLVREYQSAAICLIPSRFEAFCYVCAEAMACALPVVASGGTAMDELIQHGHSGYFVDCDKPEAVASQIEHVLAGEHLGRWIGRAARERIGALCAPHRVVAQWEAAVAARPN